MRAVMFFLLDYYKQMKSKLSTLKTNMHAGCLAMS